MNDEGTRVIGRWVSAAPVTAIGQASRAALAHAGAMDSLAELWITECVDDGVLLGAFQRRAGLALGAGPQLSFSVARRGSGGPAVRLGPGTLHLALVLSRTDALTSSDAPRLVNRYVRPLLRALTRVGATASYGGRDWISVGGRPAGAIFFSHDAASNRAVVEAFLAVRTPFAVDAARPSYLGKSPGTLETITGRSFEPGSIARAIEEAYAAAYRVRLVDISRPAAVDAEPAFDRAPSPGDRPWEATTEEAIGTLGAGFDGEGAFRIGGDLMVSADAWSALEQRLSALVGRAPELDESAIAAAVDQALGAPGVVMEGVRARASLVEVIARAARSSQKRT